eukprot:10600258-Alexandrium_andersonii.AAC.1
MASEAERLRASARAHGRLAGLRGCGFGPSFRHGRSDELSLGRDEQVGIRGWPSHRGHGRPS